MGTADGAAQEPNGRRRWPRWLTAPRLLLPVLLIAALVALLVGPTPARRYVVERSGSCESCHAPAAREAHASAHGELPCSSCHESELGQNLKQWALTLASSGSTPHGRVDTDTCAACHTSGGVERWQLERTQGHVAHVLMADEPLECSACHELAQHRTNPKPEACASCHDEIALFDHTARDMPGGQPAPCLSCHEFLARTDVGKKTLVTDCRRCHGGADPSAPVSLLATTVPAKKVSPGQIHANLAACSSCHDPHAEQAAERNRGTDCTRCHDRVSQEHHAQKQPGKFDCATCHQVHGPRAALSASCKSCHAQVTEPLTTVAREHQRCTQCHAAHDFVAPEDGCKSCHAPAVTTLAGWGAKKHAACETCHAAHDPLPEAARCAGCHGKQARHEHASCTTCHAPHQDAAQTATCESCHAPQLAQTDRALPAHRAKGCATCHQPHGQDFEATACRGCHAGEVRLVATAQVPGPGHRECASCHEPHVFGASEGACGKCHAIPNDGPHSGACGKCHEPHGPPSARAQSCASCHQNVPRSRGKHGECTSCHAPAHAPEDGRVASCESCHAPQARAAGAWKAPKHQACDSCHSDHQPAQPAACTSCHGELAPTVKAAGHRCSSCHETHAPTSGILGRCGSCHERAAAAVSGRGPTHSACASCHEPHSRTATPSCQSCHASPPALHAVREHQRCRDCHSTHDDTGATPAQCLTCHTEQRTNHYPGTRSCVGCHLFE